MVNRMDSIQTDTSYRTTVLGESPEGGDGVGLSQQCQCQLSPDQLYTGHGA